MRWRAEDLGLSLRWRHGWLECADRITTFPTAAVPGSAELRSEGNT